VPNITEAFMTQATGALELVLQQESSLLRQQVMVKSMKGEDSTVINQVGETEAQVLAIEK
jgi:hypothetical protein